jgi:hypothetical protein
MGMNAIGSGLKTTLGDIKLQVYAPNELPDSINPPCAVILPSETLYDVDFDADYDLQIRLVIMIAKPDQPSAINKILDYIEPTGTYSILAKVKADRTLNTTCADCKVVRNSGVGFTAWGGINYISTEFLIQIWST